MADEARRRGVDGVICGHIHKAESRMIDGIAYINDGDWVESCTALVEHQSGQMEILQWTKVRADRAAAAADPEGGPATPPRLGQPIAA